MDTIRIRTERNETEQKVPLRKVPHFNFKTSFTFSAQTDR